MAGNIGMFADYGGNFYNQQPNFNGQNMFVPGMMQMQNMQNQQQQVNYNKISLERANSFMELRFKKTNKRTQSF